MFNYEDPKDYKDTWVKMDNIVIQKHINLLDVSGSMARRLNHAKEVLESKLTPGEGIIVFGDTVFFIPSFEMKTITLMGNTAMLPAIRMAFERHLAESITIITDGNPNCYGEITDIIDYVSTLFGVTINAIGIGVYVDSDFLTTLTDMANGSYNHIDNIEELENAMLLLEAPNTITL